MKIMNNKVVSMTGFGRARAALGPQTVGVEIRSLNHRGLDVKLRAYDMQLAPEIEAEILRMVRQTLARGSVAISLRDETADGQGGALDTSRVRQLHTALDHLRQEMGLPGPLDLATVGTFMGAAKAGPATEIPPASWQTLAPAIEVALASLRAMREQEGAAICADLASRLATLRVLVEKIAELAVLVPGRAGRRLEERLAMLVGGNQAIDPARLAQEVALLADRLDVSEEIVRLRAHFDHLATLLDGQAKDAPGRRIDFLAQEIGREFNTLGGKIQDATISALVIDGKAELEKLREQAQNIE
jgi:uncharacterized protein (TIGR00255 family)